MFNVVEFGEKEDFNSYLLNFIRIILCLKLQNTRY
ncbi:hypothetical protein J2X17_003667 [Flavobacterium aquidurense]|nr:hypothetical protein [Flavobacterium aquidurense]